MRKFILLGILMFVVAATNAQRARESFNTGWRFLLGDDSLASQSTYNDNAWRKLNLPHDWSIEGKFDKDNPAKPDGGALPTGIGWYRKTFDLPFAQDKEVFIAFDGIYRNGEVWINGHYLGKRPYGYSSFEYRISPYLNKNSKANVIAVRVDNSQQPASRWYTGSGIYRNTWLITTGSIAVAHWGTFISTPSVQSKEATIQVQTSISNYTAKGGSVGVSTDIIDAHGKLVYRADSKKAKNIVFENGKAIQQTSIILSNPHLWSVDDPYLYKAVTKVYSNDKLVDVYETCFGIRSIRFDARKGFMLNEKPLKILGVCNHHDLGAFGAAVNTRAIERQLEILKAMGCNAIRTAHNPPAPELLDLCDKMGFLVMDEAFDMWKKRKNKFDYNVEFDEWHERDLTDLVLRDRNHPSVIMWSIGNEIREQFDTSGIRITQELVEIVKKHDPTRPVTCALTETVPGKNNIYLSGALDVLGFNYKEFNYPNLPDDFPGQAFIASETNSVLATRGHYDMPSDSVRLWPPAYNAEFPGNDDLTVSAYDHVYAYWGASHEASWKAIRSVPHMSGLFVWAGFDFIGEPVPYPWPARSSYYGIIDLAGFPKDSYYFYQSEWTTKPMLHLFPHWNWSQTPAGQPGKQVDVWAYYNQADEVELFLNGKSLGKSSKTNDRLHAFWRVPYEPGTLKAVSRLKGKTVLEKEIHTAGKPARIKLEADRNSISADGKDISFVTVRVEDEHGNLVPDAGNLVKFAIKGAGFIAGVDNGYQASMEPFKANYRKAYNGLCLAMVQSLGKAGDIVLEARSDGLQTATINITCK
jgi:beta-galactosidase